MACRWLWINVLVVLGGGGGLRGSRSIGAARAGESGAQADIQPSSLTGGGLFMSMTNIMPISRVTIKQRHAIHIHPVVLLATPSVSVPSP